VENTVDEKDVDCNHPKATWLVGVPLPSHNSPKGMFLSWLTPIREARAETIAESVLSSQIVRFAHTRKAVSGTFGRE